MTMKFAISEAGAFDALIDEFYRVWLRYHPDLSLHLGIEDYAGLLPAIDEDDVGALLSWLESFLVALEELDFASLDEDRQLDWQVACGAVQTEHYEWLEHDWRRRDPGRFLPLPLIRQLSLRTDSASEHALSELLHWLPEHLRHARTLLAQVPELVSRLALAAALEQVQIGESFLRQLGSIPRQDRPPSFKSRHQRLCATAEEAVKSYRDFLSRELAPQASGTTGVGEACYRRRWTRQQQLPFDPGKLAGWLEAQRGSAEQRPQPHGGRTEPKPGFPVAEAFVVEGEQPGLANAICQRLRQGILEADLYSLPDRSLGFRLGFLGPPPLAAERCYWAPKPPTEAAILFLPQEGSGADDLFRLLLDTGWTGTHLLVNAVEEAGRSLPRRAHVPPGLMDGWRLYLRRLLWQAGVFAEGREADLVLEEDLAARVEAWVDLGLHSGQLCYRAAIEVLCGKLGWERPRADRRLTAILAEPTRAAATLVTADLIQHGAEELVSTGILSARRYHDDLLQQGPIALPLALRRIYGEETWGNIFGRLEY